MKREKKWKYRKASLNGHLSASTTPLNWSLYLHPKTPSYNMDYDSTHFTRHSVTTCPDMTLVVART